MSLSNIKSSLLSSRRFLWKLKERLRSDTPGTSNKTPKNFTFDHDSIKEFKLSKTHTIKWIFFLPAVLLVGVTGFLALIAGLMVMFLMHGVKLLWEGYNFRSKRKSPRKVRLRVSKKCRRMVLNNFRSNMQTEGSFSH